MLEEISERADMQSLGPVCVSLDEESTYLCELRRKLSLPLPSSLGSKSNLINPTISRRSHKSAESESESESEGPA